MKVIAVLARKGGTGKTTIAVHLGVLAEAQGMKVLFFDLDPQKSLTAWWETREASTPPLVQSDTRRLAGHLKAAREEGYDLAVIDSPPAIGFETAHVAGLADLALVPLRPSILDLRAVQDTLTIITATRTPALLVLNSCIPPTAAGEAPGTLDARKALAAPVAETSLAQRLDFARALNAGEAVTEAAPDSRAAAEIARLWDEVKERIA